jgi:hypothetical protein
MGTTTKLTFEEFRNLPEREGTHYELDEGELLMKPSPERGTTLFISALR